MHPQRGGWMEAGEGSRQSVSTFDSDTFDAAAFCRTVVAGETRASLEARLESISTQRDATVAELKSEVVKHHSSFIRASRQISAIEGMLESARGNLKQTIASAKALQRVPLLGTASSSSSASGPASASASASSAAKSLSSVSLVSSISSVSSAAPDAPFVAILACLDEIDCELFCGSLAVCVEALLRARHLLGQATSEEGGGAQDGAARGGRVERRQVRRRMHEVTAKLTAALMESVQIGGGPSAERYCHGGIVTAEAESGESGESRASGDCKGKDGSGEDSRGGEGGSGDDTPLMLLVRMGRVEVASRAFLEARSKALAQCTRRKVDEVKLGTRGNHWDSSVAIAAAAVESIVDTQREYVARFSTAATTMALGGDVDGGGMEQAHHALLVEWALRETDIVASKLRFQSFPLRFTDHAAATACGSTGNVDVDEKASRDGDDGGDGDGRLSISGLVTIVGVGPEEVRQLCDCFARIHRTFEGAGDVGVPLWGRLVTALWPGIESALALRCARIKLEVQALVREEPWVWAMHEGAGRGVCGHADGGGGVANGDGETKTAQLSDASPGSRNTGGCTSLHMTTSAALLRAQLNGFLDDVAVLSACFPVGWDWLPGALVGGGFGLLQWYISVLGSLSSGSGEEINNGTLMALLGNARQVSGQVAIATVRTLERSYRVSSSVLESEMRQCARRCADVGALVCARLARELVDALSWSGVDYSEDSTQQGKGMGGAHGDSAFVTTARTWLDSLHGASRVIWKEDAEANKANTPAKDFALTSWERANTDAAMRHLRPAVVVATVVEWTLRIMSGDMSDNAASCESGDEATLSSQTTLSMLGHEGASQTLLAAVKAPFMWDWDNDVPTAASVSDGGLARLTEDLQQLVKSCDAIATLHSPLCDIMVAALIDIAGQRRNNVRAT